jgi:Flp pilus assembly protein TadD
VATSEARILRLAELHFERQRERDAACDMQFADYITANHQRELLFTTQGHPALPLARLLIERVFLAMDVPYSLIDAAVRSLRVSPFPTNELPIHPGVAEALGLGFAGPEQRYLFQNEGRYTFAEYAHRYLAFAWEPELARGLVQINAGQAETGVPLMQAGLQRCEGTARAWRALSWGLDRLGQTAAADEAMQTAIARDPLDDENFASLAQSLSRRGDFAGAAAAARRAIELFPNGTAGHWALAELLGRQGRPGRAAAVARMAFANDPGEPKSMAHLAYYLQRIGRVGEAERLLHQAIGLMPQAISFRRQLEELQARLAKERAAPIQVPAAVAAAVGLPAAPA